MHNESGMYNLILITLALMAFSSPAVATPSGPVAQIEVLPGWRTSDGDHMAGLRISLAPGWKTYWRAPGDAGIPPAFSFAGSENITGVSPHWPVPEVFETNGMRTIGYHDSVVFPITILSDAPDQPMRIMGQLEIGVCEEICVPVTLTFDRLLPPGGDMNSAITAALINQPLTQADAGVGKVTCAIEPIRDGLRLTAAFDIAQSGPSEVVVIESGDAQIWVSEAQTTRNGSQLRATADMVHVSGAAFALDRSKVRITVLSGNHAVDLRGCTAG